MTSDPTATKLFVGIDGGGTRATGVALDERGVERARSAGDAGLVDPNDPAGRAPGLAGLCARLVEQAGGERPAEVLCCALAGAGREPERSTLERAIAATGVARAVRIVTDAESAMEDALADGPGILLIAGTGSIAWGRAEDGRVARAGGWGQVLGDEGSGYAIGHAALQAIARAHDGRAPATPMTQLVLEIAGVESPERLIAWTAAASKAKVASLTPAVFDAERGGDPAARCILESEAEGLAAHATALIERLGPWREMPPIALSGGLILPGRPLRPFLERALAEIPHPGTVLDRTVDAARGAAALARRSAGA